jgi:hypothetical protein
MKVLCQSVLLMVMKKRIKKTVFPGKRKLWIAYPALTQHAGMRPQAGPTNRHTREIWVSVGVEQSHEYGGTTLQRTIDVLTSKTTIIIFIVKTRTDRKKKERWIMIL